MVRTIRALSRLWRNGSACSMSPNIASPLTSSDKNANLLFTHLSTVNAPECSVVSEPVGSYMGSLCLFMSIPNLRVV